MQQDMERRQWLNYSLAVCGQIRLVTSVRKLHALIQAIYNEEKELVKLLVASGADVNKVDESGRTPLHHAAVHRMKDLAKLLVA